MANNQKIFSTIVRVPKNESAFLYFILEAHEGLCFYSTLPSSLGQSYRDVHIQSSVHFIEEIDQVINKLSQEVNLIVKKREIT